MRFFEVDSAVDAIMSAAMLAQTKAGSRDMQGQLSMNGFLQMLKNVGIMMDYEGFKTVYDTNPQLANVIAKFDKDSITFISADGDNQEVDNTKPSNQTPPDERITQMARSAVRTREFKESIVKEASFSNEMIEKLRAAYEPLRGKKIPPLPLMKIFDKIDSNKDGLEQLYKADIPFVSMMAMSRLMLKHNYKADDINKLGSIRKENFQANEDEKDDAKLMTQQLRDISEHRRMLENMIIKLAELNKSSGDLTDQLQTMFDLNTKFSAVVRRSMAIVPVYEDMNEAIPTSEYDYDIKKFFTKVQELEDENQHGEVAEMLTKMYGTNSELMIIQGINGMHAKEGSIGPEAQKLRDKISTKYYYQAEQDAKDMKEGFASDAQRKAAFASGYDPSKKKKQKESIHEGMMDKIEKDIDAGMSADAIIGKYANKRTTNTDEIRKMIQKIKFKKFRNK